MKFNFFIPILLLFFSMNILVSCKQQERLSGDLIISNVNVVDILKEQIVPGQDILINGNTIQKIVPHGEFSLDSGEIVDARGKFIIPGLWDMHAHVRSYSQNDNLPMFIRYGITGIRDLGLTNYELIKYWKEKIASKEIMGPRIQSSGVIIEGASARFPSSVVINDMEDVQPTLDSLISQKVDVIKLFQNIPSDVFKEIIRYANEKSIVTSGHIPNDMNQITAAEAGLGSIEHLFGIGNTLANSEQFTFSKEEVQKLATVLRENNTYECPTMVNLAYFVKLGKASKDSLVAQQLFEKDSALKLTPAYFKAWWSAIKTRNMANFDQEDYERFHKQLAFNGEVINTLHDLGVKILAGTDVPNPYIITGISLHEELEQFVHAGMKPVDALKTATLYPAQYFKKENSMGVVAPNYMADLVILEADPLQDISNTKHIHAVISNGEFYSNKTLSRIENAQKEQLSEYKVTDFDQYIYMDVRRNGIDIVRKKYPDLKSNKEYTVEKHHLLRLARALRGGMQPQEAIKALEWNLALFPNDEASLGLQSEIAEKNKEL